jgi:ribosomal protein S18 acetylase RimI-like enzyme
MVVNHFDAASQSKHLASIPCGMLPEITAESLKELYENDRSSVVMTAYVIGEPHDFNGTAGYVHYRLMEKRVELIRMVVDPVFRRMGIGRQLFEFVRTKLNAKRSRIVASVREDDLDSLLFCKAMKHGQCRNIRSNVGPDIVQWSWVDVFDY